MTFQIIVHSDNDHNDGVEHYVPLVAHIRTANVGERGLAVPGPALLHAEDESHTSLLRDVSASSAVYLWHESVRDRATV